MNEKRRFPRPWTTVEIPGGYAVEDAAGMRICYVYARTGREAGTIRGHLDWDDARRIAGAIARLPSLLEANKAEA